MRIERLDKEDSEYIQQMAALLVDSFKDTGSMAWPDQESGLKEVLECLQDDRICIAAFDELNNLIGWAGALRKYENVTWELHPIMVAEEHRGQRIGSQLVAALEEAVRESGGETLVLGADDENFRTSVAGVDLYPNVLENLMNIKNPGRHPYEFYQKIGFSLVGIIPDANGPGKPDILMAKRIAQK